MSFKSLLDCRLISQQLDPRFISSTQIIIKLCMPCKVTTRLLDYQGKWKPATFRLFPAEGRLSLSRWSLNVSGNHSLYNITVFKTNFNFQIPKIKTFSSGSVYYDAINLRVRTVAKRHMRSSMFTASFILVSCVKLS